ncbi:DUF397 domain-containing protein [Streptomyces sp. NPDC048182]|uniref:DUF397 domain-containing protein n=1 Tax=Streptomyces sp. NPDC048182 TaxID=3365507 RepID=UPI00371CDE88
MTSALNWFKSSYSGNDGPECVEVAITATVHVRDSKRPDDAQLSVSNDAWSAFTAFAGE